jgi:hypothetical protein
MNLYILKLSGPVRGAVHALMPDAALVSSSSDSDLAHIPESDEPLILYVVGHAVPNGLIDANGVTLSEKDVAAQIRAKRDGKPTVIVWDVCYAGSFLDIEGCEDWRDEYVHVFACQDYELTWHDEKGTTQFSQELQRAVAELKRKGDWTWDMLEDTLQQQLGTLQIPDIVKCDHAPQPDKFGL